MDIEQRKSFWWIVLFSSLFAGIGFGLDELLRDTASFEMDRVERLLETLTMTVWFPGLFILICLALIKVRWCKEALVGFVILPIVWPFVIGMFEVVNVHLDASDSMEVEGVVIEKRVIRRRNKHLLRLQVGATSDNVLRVSSTLFSVTQEGDHICLTQRRGFFGVSWVETFRLCGKGGE